MNIAIDKLADEIRKIAVGAANEARAERGMAPMKDFEWQDGPEPLKEGWRAVARWHIEQQAMPAGLQEALNSGDGTYRP